MTGSMFWIKTVLIRQNIFGEQVSNSKAVLRPNVP
jgi:hypothetical protein